MRRRKAGTLGAILGANNYIMQHDRIAAGPYPENIFLDELAANKIA
jgi:hypothetical protein